jgi:hypothetical protein
MASTMSRCCRVSRSVAPAAELRDGHWWVPEHPRRMGEWLVCTSS